MVPLLSLLSVNMCMSNIFTDNRMNFKISITFTTTILLSSAIFLISVKRAVISSGYLSSVPSIKIVTTKVSSDGALLTN